MNRVVSSAVVVAGLVLTLSGAASWGAGPSNNDVSDINGNTAGGTNALVNNTTGIGNTAFGASALESNISGYNNTANGELALRRNTAGHDNTASGAGALLNNTGNYNTASGASALQNNTAGNFNTAVGAEALTTNSSDDNTALSGSTKPVYINSSGQLGTPATVSSARYKRDIQDMRKRSQGLYQLRPVTFRYKQDPQGQQQYGLIAEEVAKVYPELVTRGADGKVESVQYHELIPMLLNEVQHQQQEIVELRAQAQQVAELKAQNESLRAALVQRDEEQRVQNAALAARLEQLEAGAVRAATLATR